MADNYLITGYCGKPHVTAENDRGINAGIFGSGRYVMPVGKQFNAEYIGSNTVRLYDGKLVDNGAAAGIPAGEYIDMVIPSASQGMNRNDLIVFQYSQDSSTLIESGTFEVIRGVETSGVAVDPELRHEDLLSGRATFDQMALWRVSISTSEISDPVQLFKVSRSLDKSASDNVVVDAVSDDGVSYSASVENLEELYSGFEITVIPNITSTTTAPTLNLNGLGAKPILLSLSIDNSILVQPVEKGYYVAERPLKLMFDSKHLTTGAWRVANKQRTSAEDIYGTIPVEKGGTGATTVEAARNALGLGNTSGALPIANGGHGGETRKTGFANLAFLENNPVTAGTDTVAKWIELGSGFAGITKNCTVNQPVTYGTILNIIVENYNVHQLFIATGGDLYLRTGGGGKWSNYWRSFFLPAAGGTITGKTTLHGPLVLKEGVHYGESFPDDAEVGRIFWMPEVMEDV